VFFERGTSGSKEWPSAGGMAPSAPGSFFTYKKTYSERNSWRTAGMPNYQSGNMPFLRSRILMMKFRKRYHRGFLGASILLFIFGEYDHLEEWI
jgi:hypothetical protein